MNSNIHVQQFVRYFLVCIFLILITVVIVRNAWLTEDAFITFRTVDNFVNGYGLTWNVDERVQAYTNPLWMFLISAVYFFSHEIYFTAIYVSIAVSVLALLLFTVKIAQTWQAAFIGIAVLCFSKAFIDFAASGLENPLTFLLIAIFFAIYFKRKFNLQTLFFLSLVASLSAVNRMDTILFFIPPLIHVYAEARKWIRGIFIGCIGFLPFFLWAGFSLFYYGFPFPNTAYAKLNTGISDMSLALQGVNYFRNSFEIDPISLMVIGAGIFSFCLTKKKRSISLALGILFYLLYILKIGGDFMSGRFFAAPVFCAVINICAAPPGVSKVIWAPALVLSLFIGLQAPQSPVFSGKDYQNRAVLHNGIADERGWYYPCTGYLIALKRKNMPSCGWAWEGRKIRKESRGRQVIKEGFVGLVAFYAGPDVHYIDYHALTDPLLSRINIVNLKSWRIGHFIRNIPKGYKETVETGKNVIVNKRLAAYYDKLSLITRGDLFDPGRLKEIIHMNMGKYDHLLSQYRNALVRLDVIDMGSEKQEGTRWDKIGNYLFSNQGVHINFKKRIHADHIEVSLLHNRRYGILYFNGFFDISGQGMQVLEPHKSEKGGLALYSINVPPKTAKKGYTSIRIIPRDSIPRDRMPRDSIPRDRMPEQSKGTFSIGHVKVPEVDGDPDTIARE